MGEGVGGGGGCLLYLGDRGQLAGEEVLKLLGLQRGAVSGSRVELRDQGAYGLL